MSEQTDNVIRPKFGKVAAENAAPVVSEGVTAFPTKQVALPAPAEVQASPESLKANLTPQQQAQWAMWFSMSGDLPRLCVTSTPRTARGCGPKKPTPPTIPSGTPAAMRLRLVANNDTYVEQRMAA